MPFDARDAVVFCETFIEHGEVAVDYVARPEILGEQFVKIFFRLGYHRVLQVLLELWVQLGIGLGEVDVAQV